MDVTLIEPEDKAAVPFNDLESGDLFAFSDYPRLAKLRQAGNRYCRLDDWAHVTVPSQGIARSVIKLELAGTKGQTLLLRRAE